MKANGMGASRRLWPLLLGLLLMACNAPPATPAAPGVLPTLMVLPSQTPLPTTPSPSPTASRPPPTFTPTATPTATATITPTRPALAQIVIAVQPIPAGAVIPAEAVQLVTWPEPALPLNAAVRLNQVVGRVSQAYVACYEPLLTPTLARRTIPGDTPPLDGSCDPLPPEETIGAMTNVVIAARYLEPGTVIYPHLVALRPWPVALLPPGAQTSLAQVVGGEVQRGVFREQPLLAANLSAVVVER